VAALLRRPFLVGGGLLRAANPLDQARAIKGIASSKGLRCGLTVVSISWDNMFPTDGFYALSLAI